MLRKVQGHMILQEIVRASFSQGHEKFRTNRGIQCACISLYSLYFSSFKPIFEWSSQDLGYVILKGDQLYKEQNTLILLPCVDLPRIVGIENVKVTVTFLANVFGFFTESFSLSYLIKLLGL